jgi:hypothetical protein
VRRINPKQVLVRALFGLWLIASMAAAASLTAWHALTLPVAARTVPSVADRDGKWTLTHYLSTDCICSRAVAAYLIGRGPREEVAEEVLLIDSDDAARDAALSQSLRQHRFRVRNLSAWDASTAYGVQGVPQLEIASPGGEILFRGGYRERGAAPGAFSDLRALAALTAHQPAPVLPILGCATTQRLRGLLDPLRLKSLNNF